jgi:hypothetical protein
MKVEIISLNILAHSLSHATSSGGKAIKFDKNEFFSNSLKYIEEYITKNGFDIINVHGSDQMYVYHLIKR